MRAERLLTFLAHRRVGQAAFSVARELDVGEYISRSWALRSRHYLLCLFEHICNRNAECLVSAFLPLRLAEVGQVTFDASHASVKQFDVSPSRH